MGGQLWVWLFGHCSGRDVSAVLLLMPSYVASAEGSRGYIGLLDYANESTSLKEISANKNMSRARMVILFSLITNIY